MNKNKPRKLYILSCEDDTFYVGISSNVKKRIVKHVSGKGSSWTKLHVVEGVVKIRNERSKFDEDITVKKMMSKNGINKVRGGIYCEVKLPVEKIRILKETLDGADDLCFICHEPGHLKRQCPKYRNVNTCYGCGKIGHFRENCPEMKCYKCGKMGHYASKCTN